MHRPCSSARYAFRSKLRWSEHSRTVVAALDPPGWNCRAVDEFNHTGKCYPEEGWHFEERNGRRVAVRDITPSQEDRDLDINTANAWKDLTNDQRREILAGRATIYTYFDFEPPPSKK